MWESGSGLHTWKTELRLLEMARASFFSYVYQLHPQKGRLHKNILRALHQGVLVVRTEH